MPTVHSRMIAGACLMVSALASPTPIERDAMTPAAALPRAAGSSPITNPNQLAAALSSFSANFNNANQAASMGMSMYSNIQPNAAPTSVPDLQQQLQTINNASAGDIFASGMGILLNGLAGDDFITIARGFTLESSTFNFNLRPAGRTIFPQQAAGDAPYSLPEAALRQVIHIPSDFTYGRIPPVVFIPGTGVRAGQNFAPNYGKLLKAQGVADPVYVNIPMEVLGDIQVNAEYVNYAINYISSISGNRKVNTIGWSQGSISTQWALKYWPSTRRFVSNKISVSPDYHGTVLARLLCPGGFPTPGSTPAVCQQNFDATFIQTLRANGGDSAYVPSTNYYSIFDEIVQPQADPNASGFLNGPPSLVTNVEVQSVCTPLLPGGTFYNTHEGMLFNALGYALAVDAIKNGGPGQLSRINATFQCAQFATPGLSLADILATEANIVIAGFNILAYQPKVADEPPIKPYARGDTPA